MKRKKHKYKNVLIVRDHNPNVNFVRYFINFNTFNLVLHQNRILFRVSTHLIFHDIYALNHKFLLVYHFNKLTNKYNDLNTFNNLFYIYIYNPKFLT